MRHHYKAVGPRIPLVSQTKDEAAVKNILNTNLWLCTTALLADILALLDSFEVLCTCCEPQMAKWVGDKLRALELQ